MSSQTHRNAQHAGESYSDSSWRNALSSSEEAALLRAAAAARFPRRNTAILLILLHTGMRLRACAALAWEDISWVGTQAQVQFRDLPGKPLRDTPARGRESGANGIWSPHVAGSTLLSVRDCPLAHPAI